MALSAISGVLLALLVSFAAAAYLRWVVSQAPVGCSRFILALPVFVVFAAAPVCFFDRSSNVVCVLLSSAFLLWWGNFKVLAFCCGGGPLEPYPKRGAEVGDFLAFTALLVLPIEIEKAKKMVKGNERRNRAKAPSTSGVNGLSGVHVVAPVNLPEKPVCQRWLLLKCSSLHGALFFALIYALDYQDSMPEVLVQVIYCFIMYSFMMFSFPLCAALASATLGVELVGHFDKPWLSNSLADYWGKRWNLTANSALKGAIYFPAKEQLERVLLLDGKRQGLGSSTWLGRITPVRRKKVAKGIAALLTFFVSGVMHEIIIFYATREASGEWTAFFTLHGAAFLIEAEVVMPLAKHFKLRVPKVVQILTTLLFLLVTADMLFFPPVVKSGLDRAGLGEFRSALRTAFGF